MKIYLVIQRDWRDCRISYTYASREMAELHLSLIPEQPPYEQAWIEEWEICADPALLEAARKAGKADQEDDASGAKLAR